MRAALRLPPAWLAAIVLAIAQLTWRLDTVPGLHGDEAWVGLRAHAILLGDRPIVGMTTYTGALHQYLVAPLLWILGYHVWVLRLVSVAGALASVVLFFAIVAREFDRRTASYGVLALVTLPFFATFGRLSGENFALNPVLALAAVWLIVTARDRPSAVARAASFAGAGVLMGLGVWNHVIFAAVPAAVAATALVRRGPGLLRASGVYWTIAGGVLALLPRWSAHVPAGVEGFDTDAFVTLLRLRAVEWPAILARILHGDVLFQRFAGEVVWSTPNVEILIAAAGLAVALTAARRGREAAVFTAVLYAVTLVICPANSDRYFLLVLYAVPVFVGVAFAWLHERPGGARVAIAAMTLLVALQASRMGVDYFGALGRSGGRTSAFAFGSQKETSNHFIRTDALYRALVDRGAQRIWARYFIAAPLQFYDLLPNRFHTVLSIDHSLPPDATAAAALNASAGNSFAIVYADGLRRVADYDYTGFDVVSRDAQFVILAAGK